MADGAANLPLELLLFGAAVARVHGEPIAPLRSRRAMWLLAMLALNRRAPLDREEIAGSLWPDSENSVALANLRRTLLDVRDALGSERWRLQSPSPRTLWLDIGGSRVDALEFDALIQAGEPAALTHACQLYAGPLLRECDQPWVVPERERRDQAFVQTLERLSEMAQQAGDPAAAAAWLRRALAADPYREGALRALMQLLAGCGQTAAAMQEYRQFRLRVRGELNTEPSPETAALYRALAAGDRTPAAAGPAHSARPAAPPRVPAPITQLLGREDALRDLTAAIERSRLVMLTGCGGVGKTRLAIAAAHAVSSQFPAGAWFVDLSALRDPALVPNEIAAALRLEHPADAPPLERVASYLGNGTAMIVLDNCEHLLAGCASAAMALLERCFGLTILATSREPLRILGEVAWPVEPLALPPQAACSPAVADKDAAAALADYASIALFLERARQAQPGFAPSSHSMGTIARICRRLDGIPLAIELAAARVRSMPVADIERRLDDRFHLLEGARGGRHEHETLAASLDWSYDLLAETEQRLLQRLSAFRGDWTADAAVAVCGARAEAGGADTDVRDSLGRLVERSLVVYDERADNGRYRLMESVREYAALRLDEQDGQAALVAERHARYYVRLASELQPDVPCRNEAERLDRLEAEQDNLRAALDTLVQIAQRQGASHEERTAAATLSVELIESALALWWMRGGTEEGVRAVRRVLELDCVVALPRLRARALMVAGKLAHHRGDYAAAAAELEAARACWMEIGDTIREALALSQLGQVLANQSEFERAEQCLEAALRALQAGDERAEAEVLGHLGYVARERGQLDRARELTERALALHRASGNRLGEAWALGSLGHAACGRGDFAGAATTFEAARAIYREFRLPAAEAWSLSSIAHARRRQGDHEGAIPLLEDAAAIDERIGHRAGSAWVLRMFGDSLRELGDIERAREVLEQAVELGTDDGNRLGLAWTICYLGDCDATEGVPDRAAKRFADAAMRFKELGADDGFVEACSRLIGLLAAKGRPDIAAALFAAATGGEYASERDSSLARRRQELVAALGAADFDRAVIVGRALTVDLALDQARAAVAAEPGKA